MSWLDKFWRRDPASAPATANTKPETPEEQLSTRVTILKGLLKFVEAKPRITFLSLLTAQASDGLQKIYPEMPEFEYAQEITQRALSALVKEASAGDGSAWRKMANAEPEAIEYDVYAPALTHLQNVLMQEAKEYAVGKTMPSVSPKPTAQR